MCLSCTNAKAAACMKSTKSTPSHCYSRIFTEYIPRLAWKILSHLGNDILFMHVCIIRFYNCYSLALNSGMQGITSKSDVRLWIPKWRQFRCTSPIALRQLTEHQARKSVRIFWSYIPRIAIIRVEPPWSRLFVTSDLSSNETTTASLLGAK